MIRKPWWKAFSVIMLLYTFTAGFLIKVPHVGNLYGSIRNLFFHVPMWFAMMVLFIVSVIYAILHLRNPAVHSDIYSKEYAKTGVVFGTLGLITGAIWANYTWGEFWSNDPKQLLAAIALLIYAAYFILRNSIPDMDKRARIAAVYNVFACAMLFPTLWIIPRMVESLHPGGQGVEGNPGMSGKDLDPTMRLVFWPAVIGWTLLGVWITTLRIRLEILKENNLQMVYNKKIILFAIAIFTQTLLFAQNAALAEVAGSNGFMRSEGKIYVAMTVAITILAGLIVFVGRLDRKISRLEKSQYK